MDLTETSQHPGPRTFAAKDPMSSAEEGLLAVDENNAVPASRRTRVLALARTVGKFAAMAAMILTSSLSWVGMKTTDTALLGHAGTEYLKAAAVSDLWTSSMGVLLSGRVLATFCGQAIGAAGKDTEKASRTAGIWLQTSLVVLAMVMVPVLVLWAVTSPVLKLLGVEASVANNAGIYAGILCIAIPSRTLFGQLRQYFQAQKLLWPEAVMSGLAVIFNLLFGYVFVLGLPGGAGFTGFGFLACPTVTVFIEWAQTILFVLVFCMMLPGELGSDYMRIPLPKWQSGVVTKARMWEYFKIYAPSAASTASDFWRFSAIGAVAAAMHPIDAAVFTSSYRVMWMCLIVVGALRRVVTIQVAPLFGANEPVRAKKIMCVGTGVACTVIAILACIIFFFSRQLGMIFSDDPEVLNRFYEIRLPFAATAALMNLTVFLEVVPSTMLYTRTTFIIGLVGSWVGQVPAVLICTQFWRKDLVGLYTGCAIGYGLTSAILAIFFCTVSFKKAADAAVARAAE